MISRFTPIGCPGNTTDLFCDLTFKLNSNTACTNNDKCGLRFKGLTHAGLAKFNDWQSYVSYQAMGYVYEYNYATGEQSLFPMDSSSMVHIAEPSAATNVFTESFCAPDPPINNPLWDSYTFPSVKVYASVVLM